MSDRLQPRARLFAAHSLTLVEVPAPMPEPWEQAAMDKMWDEAVRRNPALFDGPVAVCAGLTEDGNGRVVLEWARTTYRNFALRMVEGARSWLPSLFVAVAQPPDDGRLLVGRMGGSTAAPGRWQLPGGTVGVLFRAPGHPWETLRAGFEELRRSETEAAREPQGRRRRSRQRSVLDARGTNP